MKNLLFTLLCCTLFSIPKVSNAQDDVDRETKIEQEMGYYLTNMELNEEQKMKFSELFRKEAYEMMEAEEAEKSRNRNKGDAPAEERWYQIQEEEAHEILMSKMDWEEREFQRNREFQLKMTSIIGAKNMLRYLDLKEKFDKKQDGTNIEEGGVR